MKDFNGLREAIRRQPFKPFDIRLADGRSLPVRHPEMLAVGKRLAVLVQDDDSLVWLEPLLVVSIEWPGQQPEGDDGNGAGGSKKRRRRP
jgi:hypothetical protein